MKNTTTLILFSFLLFLSFFASAQNMMVREGRWIFGMNFGMAWQESDVRPRLGLGGGVTLERMLTRDEYSAFGFSLRGRYLRAGTWGEDGKRSYNIVNNTALNGVNRAGTNYVDQNGYVYHNYQTKINDFSLEGLISLNRLRARSGILLYGFGGLGVVHHETYMDQLDASGNMYDYSKIRSNIGSSWTRRDLRKLRDGTYETKAEGDNVVFAPSLGTGFGVRLGRGVYLGIEHKVTYPQTDLLDGQQWNVMNEPTGSYDLYHYSTLFLGIGMGGSGGNTARNRTSNNTRTRHDPYRPAPVDNVGSPSLPKPEIMVITPAQSVAVTPNCYAQITARIYHINNIDDIKVWLNSELISRNNYFFNSATAELTLNMQLNGPGTFLIGAYNSAGSASASVTFQCSAPLPNTPVSVRPVIFINNPSESPFITASCKADITATIYNIDGKHNIEVMQDGRILHSSVYDYNPATRILMLQQNLNGKGEFIINAHNNAGSATASVIIICSGQTNPVPVTSRPVIDIITPSQNPFITASCNSNIQANIYHITGKENIEVRRNNTIVDRNLYHYFPERSLFVLDQPFSDLATYSITATNNSGSAFTSLTLKCERRTLPTPALPKPVIILIPGTPSNCLADIRASVRNISGKQDIEIRQNNQIINSSMYTWDSQSQTLSFRQAIQGNTAIVILAKNQSGTEMATVNFTCQTTLPEEEKITICHYPPGNTGNPQTITIPKSALKAHLDHGDKIGPCDQVSAPAPAPKPVIIVNPGKPANCIAEINATVRNIDSKQNIEIRQNNQIVNSNLYNYNLQTKALTLRQTITENTDFVIIVSNQTGTEVATLSFVCEKAQPEEKITICHYPPGNTGNPQTITIPKSALKAHLDHGDKIGPCETGKLPAPEITVHNPTAPLNCMADIKATIRHIENKNNIELRQNGQVVNNVLYSFDPVTLLLSYYQPINANASFTITATNKTGKETASLNFTCDIIPQEEEKITICHYPPGNTGNPQTITIPKSALKAHLDHGDKIGPCDQVKTDPVKTVPTKPEEEERVTICHYPPGNTGNPQTITIPKSALKAHLDHGDKIGPCDQVQKEEPGNKPKEETRTQPRPAPGNEPGNEERNELQAEPRTQPTRPTPGNEQKNEPVNRPANQPGNEQREEPKEPRTQPTRPAPANEQKNKPVNRPANQPGNQPRNEPKNESKEETRPQQEPAPSNETKTEPKPKEEKKKEEKPQSGDQRGNRPQQGNQQQDNQGGGQQGRPKL